MLLLIHATPVSTVEAPSEWGGGSDRITGDRRGEDSHRPKTDGDEGNPRSVEQREEAAESSHLLFYRDAVAARRRKRWIVCWATFKPAVAV